MTDLQLGLALIGILAIAGVLLYNRLQERRVRREAERAFASGHSDALLDEPHGRREPTFEAPPRGAAPLDEEPTPDPRVDYVIELSAPAGVAGLVLRDLWAPVASRFARRALLSVPAKNEARAALQLVSRAGVASDAELLEFRSAVETIAAKLGARVSAPGMREALEAARNLDRACADADIQIALHVIGFPPEQANLGEENPFHVAPRPDGVTLTLDVARTPDPARAYQSMARAGLALAAARGGRLVDDNGAALDERALAAIGAQLDAVRAELAGRGIEPGSPLALRLFS